MPIYRRFLLLASVPPLLLACASALTPVHARKPTPVGPEAIEFEPQAPAPVRAHNPYAPTRSANLPQYSWRSATERRCQSEPSAKQPDAPIVLKFSGSVGVFPPIPEEVIDEQQATPEALDTWGSGEPAPSERRSPDLVVAGLRPAFRRCFSRWLDSKADAEGSVRFALELGCAGDVQAISADVQGVDESTLECLFTVVAPAQFGPPANGHATLQVPVVFKNASR
ncbi:MAG TPA: hypothetical protein VGJ91_01900 [Polyangiaceae bacterium]|jgi:hypothetical protein